MSRIKVMQVTDTLNVGGAERMAVNIVNLLPRERYDAYFCTTRFDGPQADLVADDVKWLRLKRQQRFDLGALWRLVRYIQRQQIQILHAHGPSLFIAKLASQFPPYPAVVWHDHYGRYRFDDRPVWLYRLGAGGISGVIAVNQPLVEWSRRRLRVPAKRVWYIPNFIYETNGHAVPADLPGEAGARIVCVANFRSEKDHPNLIRAMSKVIRRVPAAHLLLIGASNEPGYIETIKSEIAQLGLGQSVSLLGQRQDVSAILRACDVGVLSSASEGLPLSLLEYGLAGLPSVATQVGQCAEVLDDGGAGILVPPAEPEKLAAALLSLLESPEKRRELGKRFRSRVKDVYSSGPVIRQICHVYETVINAGRA